MAQISTRRLAQLCRRVGTALDAGLDARSVWDKEADRGSSQHRQYMAEVRQQIHQGATVAQALTATHGYFPPLTCQLVHVGEQAGRLERVLTRLADHYDHLIRLRRTFLVGIAWPMLQLIVAVLVIGGLIWILGVLGDERDVLGLGLSPSASLTVYGLGVATISLAIGLPVCALLRGWLGPYPMKLALQIPMIGTSLQTIALSRLAWALGMAHDAGMDARRSVQLGLATTQNIYYTSHADRVDRVLERGGEIHEALRQSGAFPNEFLDTVETGELTGRLSESLDHLSSEYQNRAVSTSGALVMLASFAIWAMVALVMIVMIIRLFMMYVGTIYDAMEPL